MDTNRTIEDRLLDNSIYRTLMSVIWPYQRAELLWERKAPLEFCTLMVMLLAGNQIIEAIMAGNLSTLKILSLLCVCTFAPTITKMYWYLLRYTYDIIVSPIEGDLVVDDEIECVGYVDVAEILDYVTPGKVLGGTMILILMHLPSPILMRIMPVVVAGIGFIYILMIVDSFLVVLDGCHITGAEVEDVRKNASDCPQPDSEQTTTQPTDKRNIKIMVNADLSQSDEANQELFLKSLAHARRIAPQDETDQ